MRYKGLCFFTSSAHICHLIHFENASEYEIVWTLKEYWNVKNEDIKPMIEYAKSKCEEIRKRGTDPMPTAELEMKQ